MAQRTAPSMLSNTMSRKSPPVWTILPPCSSIAGSIRWRTESPQPFERSNIVQADQAAVADHVGIDDGDQLSPILAPEALILEDQPGEDPRSRPRQRRVA